MDFEDHVGCICTSFKMLTVIIACQLAITTCSLCA